MCGHLSLNCGVATAVNNLAAMDLQDLGGSALQQLLSLSREGGTQAAADQGGAVNKCCALYSCRNMQMLAC